MSPRPVVRPEAEAQAAAVLAEDWFARVVLALVREIRRSGPTSRAFDDELAKLLEEREDFFRVLA